MAGSVAKLAGALFWYVAILVFGNASKQNK